MKSKKLKELRPEIRELSDAQLAAELKSHRADLFNLRNQLVTEKVEDNSRFGKTRKNVARLLTELRARQMKAAK